MSDMEDKPSTPLRGSGRPGTPAQIIDVEENYTAVEGIKKQIEICHFFNLFNLIY